MKRVSLLAMALAFAGAACNSAKTADAPQPDAGDDAGLVFGGNRPVTVRVPAGYDPAKPAPLVMMLHGYSAANIFTELYFKMSSIADEHGFFYVAPNGTFDKNDSRFWNATDACCNFFDAGVDDVGYLTSLIKEIQGAYNVDPKRIYVMGHSNGGFMSHRLACDHAETFAAAVSYAGAVWSDPAKCNPSAPIGILQIHGTSDEQVAFAGNLPSGDAGPGDAGASDAGTSNAAPYPGAAQTVAIWAAKNGCADALVDTGARIHVNADATGQETTVSRHDGCTKNGAAELWAVQGAPHVFSYTPDALEKIWQFLDAHAKAP